ncbi:MAG: DUF948 domain-containing protein [archaeon]
MLHLNRKGQGISMNVIIIAAIALLVLVVLAIIFLGKMGGWGQDVAYCENKGGVCSPANTACGTQGTRVSEHPIPFPTWKCPNDGEVCCVTA